MASRRLPPLRVLAALCGCPPAAAYWNLSLCYGEAVELCAAPWLHEEAPALRWAPRAGLCLTLPAGGAAPHLAACAADGEGQHFAMDLGAAGSVLRLRASPESCVGVAEGGLLAKVDCGAGPDGPRFELPERGQGPIRWRGRCLTVHAPSIELDGGARAVSLGPCEEGSESQAFLAPRELGGSAFVGVNLGGWLLLEEWMWPEQMSLRGIHDEWSLIEKYGGPEDARAKRLMHGHWDSFVQEEHLDRLARFGVTHVRVPLGYWLLDPVYNASDGFVAGGEAYLRRLMRWLKQRRMKAVLDLHALPGGQAVDGFTGRRYPKAAFFLEEEHFERGKAAVEALADLVLAYDAEASTSGVVVGIELLNEPKHSYWDAPLGIRAFYEEMVPRVRRRLSPDRYMVLLCFMDSPHTATADWLAEARHRDPVSFAGVVYDTHIYHSFGDNSAPWNPGQDYCKTCCRDLHLLEPMASKAIPSVVGEYSICTGFPSWEEEGFPRTHLENQWSLFNTTPGVVGSFQWNFRLLLPDRGFERFQEWSLLGMVAVGYLPPDGVYASDLSSRCPQLGGRVALHCPRFENATVSWNTSCEWQPRGRALGLLDEAGDEAELAGARRACGAWLIPVSLLLAFARV